jgi:hypothetical protein
MISQTVSSAPPYGANDEGWQIGRGRRIRSASRAGNSNIAYAVSPDPVDAQW